MKRQSSLGRGLGSLLSDDFSLDDDLREGTDLISIEKISPNEDQPRKHFDKKALEDLAESIKTYGVIQPLLLVEKDGAYQIVAGERRYRAAKLAGLEELPALVMDLSPREIKEISIIENIQREDLNPIEEAQAYQSLMDGYDMTQKEIGDSLGKSRSYIGNILRLLKLDDKSRYHLEKGDITSSQARTLLSIEDEKKRKKALEDFVEGKTNIRQVEKSSRTKEEEVDIFLIDMENRLSEALEAKVSLKKMKKGGQIIISYYDNEDLDRIVEKLKEED